MRRSTPLLFSLSLLAFGCGGSSSNPVPQDLGAPARHDSAATDGAASRDAGRDALAAHDLSADAPPAPACDLLSQDPCAADEACVYETDGLHCAKAGTFTAGQTCGSMPGGGCARGLVCVTPPQGGSPVCSA